MNTKTLNRFPKASICIPVYNQEGFIRNTIESTLNQKYKNFEVVISNNQCTDNTDDIIRSFQSKRIKYIIQPKYLPLMTQNWNACVRASSGKYVCLLSADDILYPDFLTEQVNLLEKYKDIAFAHSAVELINEQGKRIGFERSIHKSFVRDGTKEFLRYIWSPKCVLAGTLFRRKLFDMVGHFDEKYHIVGDWALWLKLLRHGGVAYNQIILAKYRIHKKEYRVKRAPLQYQEIFKLLEETFANWPKQIPYDSKLREQVMTHYALSALTASARLNDLKGRKILVKLASLKSNSFQVTIKAELIEHRFRYFINLLYECKLCFRQWVKKILYP